MTDDKQTENAAFEGTSASPCSIPAFPFTPTDNSGQIGPTHPGMALREWFAGHAMIAILGSAPESSDFLQKPPDEARRQVAECAYKLADAMMSARESNAGIERPQKPQEGRLT